jgi:hypothetical protein
LRIAVRIAAKPLVIVSIFFMQLEIAMRGHHPPRMAHPYCPGAAGPLFAETTMIVRLAASF